ncbi:hypothetical protein IEQ34_002497 [Dendrobium chrysotoxum]|uniref:Endonuclease/exonuclease/phosphatase domain-containing protein n=1 Tax=Dendrobium chrysotoxum TaxID=161865 RepID=A0AAV7HPS2_DENCH|nr:hypothetical protein IEQ34_002497 [Dendrobium chrysotoxum]
MGNSESSSSQSPYHGSNNESDKSKKKETEEQTSTARSALKVGAAIAGTALLAYGAWSLSSSSDSSENKSRKVGVMDGSGPGSFRTNPGFELQGDFGYHDTASRLIKVMSYNVWPREDVEVIKRMEAIGQLIQKHSPDIIFFQEITPYIYTIFYNSQWWELYECSVPPEKATKKYFCMLLSKLPVTTFRNKSFEKSKKEICLAKVDVGTNNHLVVATTHLKSPNPPKMNCSKRKAQAEEAISLLNKLPNVVFGGDMNWDESIDGPFPLDEDWVDAWTELRPGDDGWTYLRLHKRLDRFLCKLSDFKIIDIETIGMEAIPGLSYHHNNMVDRVYPSDHCGLLLTIISNL